MLLYLLIAFDAVYVLHVGRWSMLPHGQKKELLLKIGVEELL